MALSNPNWRRKDDDHDRDSFFSQADIGSSLVVQPATGGANTNSPISSASNTPITLSPEKRPLDEPSQSQAQSQAQSHRDHSPQSRPAFTGRSRTGSFHRNDHRGSLLSQSQVPSQSQSQSQESKEQTPLSPPQRNSGIHMVGGAPVPPGFMNNHRRSDSMQGRGLMPKTGPNSAAALAQQQQQQQQHVDEKGKNSPWAEIKVLNATTIAQAIHNDGTKSQRASFNRGSSQPPLISSHHHNHQHNHNNAIANNLVAAANANPTAAIVNHVPTTQGVDKQPLLLLRSQSRDDGNTPASAPTPTGNARMTPLTPKSVKRAPVQRLVPNTTNPESPLTFIPENNIIRFNKLMLEDVTLESMKANTAAAGSGAATGTATGSINGSGANSGSTTPRTQPLSLSSSTIAAILAQQAAVQKDAQAVNSVYADEELIRKRAESLQYDLHRLQEKKLRSNLRSEEHRLRQEPNLDLEHKEAQLLNHLQQSLIQCAEQKDSKVFQCVQFQQELQDKINTLQKMFDKMTNRIGVLEAEYVTCVSSLREEYSSIMTEYYPDTEVVTKKLNAIPHFVEVEQLKTTLSEQGVQVIAGRPNMTTDMEGQGQGQGQAPQPNETHATLTLSRRTSLMMYPHQPKSTTPSLTGRQVSAAPVLQPHSRLTPNGSPPSLSPLAPTRTGLVQQQLVAGAIVPTTTPNAGPAMSPSSAAATAAAAAAPSPFGIAPQLRRSSTFTGGVASSILPSGAKRPSISLHPSLMPSAGKPSGSPTNQPLATSPTANPTVAPTPTPTAATTTALNAPLSPPPASISEAAEPISPALTATPAPASAPAPTPASTAAPAPAPATSS